MLTEAIDHVRQALAGAGISVADDPRNLNLPGIWITPDMVSFDRLDGDTATVAVQLVAVSSDIGTTGALKALEALILDANTVLTVDSGQWVAASITLPNHASGPLPALRARVNVEWSA